MMHEDSCRNLAKSLAFHASMRHDAFSESDRLAIMKGCKMTQTANLTGAQMAKLIGVDPKDFRRFLRKWSDANGVETPGSGSRYSLTASQADKWRALYFADVSGGRRAVIDLDAIMLDGEMVEDVSDNDA
jgi:hypothetical protein